MPFHIGFIAKKIHCSRQEEATLLVKTCSQEMLLSKPRSGYTSWLALAGTRSVAFYSVIVFIMAYNLCKAYKVQMVFNFCEL